MVDESPIQVTFAELSQLLTSQLKKKKKAYRLSGGSLFACLSELQKTPVMAFSRSPVCD